MTNVVMENVNIIMGKRLAKCYKLLNEARRLLNNNKLPHAKRAYLSAREIYVILEYHEKKELYHELNEIFKTIKKLEE